MAFDPDLADRVRAAVAGHALRHALTLDEKKMFGGLAFMVGGKMACGLSGDDLMVRVGPERHAEALAAPHARPMDFTGRPMKGYVFVGPASTLDDAVLEHWAGQAVDHVAGLLR